MARTGWEVEGAGEDGVDRRQVNGAGATVAMHRSATSHAAGTAGCDYTEVE
jgi:hypothetical protein